MSTNKTVPIGADMGLFLSLIMPEARASGDMRLDALFREVTGFPPVMWGSSISGHGRSCYRYASGREGDFLAIGFSPGKTAFGIQIMPGYAEFSDILARLGRHKTGKSCLHIREIADMDLDVLGEVIEAGLDDLACLWPVFPA